MILTTTGRRAEEGNGTAGSTVFSGDCPGGEHHGSGKLSSHDAAHPVPGQIRDLEEELGQKLLVRGSHRVTLTAEGMLLRKRAEEIVAMADKTEDAFRAMKGDLSGDIYIGGGETDAMNLIATVCRELQEEHPGIRYHLFSGNAQDVTERLDKGLLDFGLLIQPTDIAKYDYLSLPAKDTWGVILRRDAPLATKSCVRWKTWWTCP